MSTKTHTIAEPPGPALLPQKSKMRRKTDLPWEDYFDGDKERAKKRFLDLTEAAVRILPAYALNACSQNLATAIDYHTNSGTCFASSFSADFHGEKEEANRCGLVVVGGKRQPARSRPITGGDSDGTDH